MFDLRVPVGIPNAFGAPSGSIESGTSAASAAARDRSAIASPSCRTVTKRWPRWRRSR